MSTFTYYQPSRSAAAHASGQPAQGAIISGRRARYRITSVLHRGKHTVYAGVIVGYGRDVIIKESSLKTRALDSQDSPDLTFRSEAKILQLLSQYKLPTPRCLEICVFADRTYLIMTRIPGTTLEDVARAGSLDETRAIDCILDICTMAMWCHTLNIVHHDIKPANIMIRPDGRAVLIDYGSSEPIRPRGDLRYKGTCTADFASPEQISGQALVTDDVYSIGKTIEAVIPAPTPELAAIIARATALIEQRYQSVDELRQDLLRLRAVRQLTQRFSAAVASCFAVVRRALFAALAIILLLLLYLSLAQQSPTSSGLIDTRPLQPIFLPTATPETSRPEKPAQTTQAEPAPDHEILQCYQQYQASREHVFATADMRHLECVAKDSLLSQRLSQEIAELAHNTRYRRIQQNHRIVSLTVTGDQAILVVDKIESRYDFPLACGAQSPSESCVPVSEVTDDRYQATFHLQKLDGRWLLVSVDLNR